MNPFYFGESEKQLFGVYHQSKAQFGSDKGVVLCPPIGREYMRTHWAFRQLAGLLSKEAYHVLRFDYYGIGDSAGDGMEGSVTQWKKDIITAVCELKDISGVNKVSLVGLRLGAALAAEVVNEGLSIDDLLLWEPILKGKNYFAELKEMHKKTLVQLNQFSFYKVKYFNNELEELLGYPFPKKLQTDIECIDISKIPLYKANRVFIINSTERKCDLEFKKSLTDSGVKYSHHLAKNRIDWKRFEEIEDTILPFDMIKLMVGVLTEKDV